jgi:hypothetical protein
VGDDLLRQGGHGGSITVTDSLFDHTCWYTGSHLDAFQMYDPGDVSHALLNHDTLNSRPVNHSGTGDAAIFWADHPGAGSTLEVEHSMLAGGDYTTALYDATAGSGVVINVHNNVYVNHSWNYGPCDSNSVSYTGHEGLEFTNNVLDMGEAMTC